jgi:hypothetical protein
VQLVVALQVVEALLVQLVVPLQVVEALPVQLVVALQVVEALLVQLVVPLQVVEALLVQLVVALQVVQGLLVKRAKVLLVPGIMTLPLAVIRIAAAHHLGFHQNMVPTELIDLDRLHSDLLQKKLLFRLLMIVAIRLILGVLESTQFHSTSNYHLG